MNGGKKRKPIRRQTQRLVLLVTFLAVLYLTAAAAYGMHYLKRRSEEILTEQMMRNLEAIVLDKAELAESEIRVYEDQVRLFAGYAHDVYETPEHYVKNEVLPPLHTTPQGVFSMSRAFADASIDPKDPEVKAELELLGAMEQIFVPVTEDNGGKVSTVYMGTETGLLISYDTYAYEASTDDDADMVFDYFSREWYRTGKKASGVFWTGVYADEFGRGLNITCGAPVFTGRGEFRGVVAEDIMITDLYDSLTRLSLGDGAYVILLDQEGRVISPEMDGETVRDLELNEEEIAKVLSGETGLFFSDEEVYHAYTPLEGLGWTLLIHVPSSLIKSPVNKMGTVIGLVLVTILAVSVEVLLITVPVSGKFASRLTRPVIELINKVERMKNGDLDCRAEIMENDEVGDLAAGFNEMADSMKRHIENVTAMTAEREKAQTELDIAAGIQADILATDYPAFPGRTDFDICARAYPAKEIGGDFYDHFLIDEDHLALVIADVSGKGVPAALFMVVTKTLIKNRTLAGGTPAEILSDVNDQLCSENKAEIFVTAWLGILTLSTGELIDANAGHEYPAFRQGGRKYEFLRVEHNPPLATIPGLQFTDRRMQLGEGDAIFLYTDGVSEAKNPEGVRFGLNRVTELLNREPEANTREVIESFRSELKRFVGAAKPFDDVTMLNLIYFGQGGKS